MEKQVVVEEKMEGSAQQKMIQQSPKPKKGGFRTLPFIIVNESFEKVASYGLMPNMIFYLMNDYHIGAANGASLISIWAAISNAMAIVGALVSDSYLGRFWVIVLGSFSSLLGMTILWLTAMIPQLKPPPCPMYSSDCSSATPVQVIVLITSFGLISIGAGCIRPCSMAFGADQLDKKDNNPNNKRLIESFFNWYYASIGVSTVVALTIIVYIQDHLGWKVGFGVPAVLMVFSALMFLFGSNLYVKVKAETSLLTTLVQVFVASLRKRSLDPSASNANCYQGQYSTCTNPTDNLRFLNRACMIANPEEELKADGTISNPWKLCSIEQVESLKALIRVMPMWSTGIVMLLSLNQHGLASLQAQFMDRHVTPNFKIPAGSFSVFTIITLTIWVAIYDRALAPFLVKLTGNPRGLGPKVRMGIGLLLSIVAMMMSAVVEIIRRKKAIDQGLADKPMAVMDMSAMWLIPQFCLFGVAEAFNAIGQIEFYYSQLPKSMGSMAMAIFTLGMAVASLLGGVLAKIVDGVTGKDGKESWLTRNLNKGHLDYYYWLVTIISLVNFGYFLICCCWCYGPSKDETKMTQETKEDESRD